MAASKAAEDGVKNCHRCGKEFSKRDVRMPTPKKEDRLHFRFLCLECFEQEGGVWWANNRRQLRD